MINAIITFIFLWITSCFWHEFMHILQGTVDGAKDGRIIFTRYTIIPSMQVLMQGIIHRKRFLFAGGFYTSILFFFLAYLWHCQIAFIIAFAQLVYSFYELIFRDRLEHKDYMFYHYLAYILGGAIAWIILKYLPLLRP